MSAGTIAPDGAVADRTDGGDGRSAERTHVVCVGTNIPEELISARGLVPTYVTGTLVDETPEADEYLEGKYGAEFRSVLQSLLDGAADTAALLVFDRRFRDLFYYVKEMVRLGWLPALPPVHLFDLILSRAVDATAFNLDQVRRLDDVLGRAAADRVPDVPLADVVDADNAWRAEVRQLLDLRRRRRVTGVEAFDALSRRRSMTRSEHARALAELNGRLTAAADDMPAGPAVLLATGEPLYHDLLHRAVEATGAIVVAEDSEWGSRLAGDDVQEASHAALRDKYWADATGPELRPFEARAAWLLGAVEQYRPQIVVIWIPPSDVLFGWDYPRLAEHIRAAGVQPVLLRTDVLNDTDLEATITELSRALDDVRHAEGTVR